MLFRLQLFILFVLAPFVGVYFAYSHLQPFSFKEMDALAIKPASFQEEADMVSTQLLVFQESLWDISHMTEASASLIHHIRMGADEDRRAYEEQHSVLQDLVSASREQSRASDEMLDFLLANMLGDPVGQTFGERSTTKVYSLEEVGYRGYMAKVRLHSLDGLEMVLAQDRVASQGETTRAAAERSGAVLAINAGGFTSQNGSLIPLGTTVISGEIVTFSADSNLSFVGFNANGQLVGGRYETREQLKEQDVLHGASFLPTLLKNGEKQPIPAGWANTRHPRTLIGHFDNGDILVIVIDGRREGWSLGVTLEEAQRKLLEFHVRDAYNLDGGGSSTFYYNGRVLNRPSGGERRVTTNIIIKP